MEETTNPLLLDLPGSVPNLESGLQVIGREQAIDVEKAGYLGMLRVNLIKLLHECLALGAKSECKSSTADQADEETET